MGRFISPDTIVPDPGNPQAFNRYSYVYNNALRYIDPTGHFTDEELHQLFGIEDTLGHEKLVEYFTELFGEFWSETLTNASWEDEVFIDDNPYAFVFGHGRWRGTSIISTEASELSSRITLAFWDVNNSRSVNFLQGVWESQRAENAELVTRANSKWKQPHYFENPNADEYVWYDRAWNNYVGEVAWLEVKLTAFGVGVAEGGISGAVAVAVLAVDTADNLKDTYELFTGDPFKGAIPYLHQGSPQNKVWSEYQRMNGCRGSSWGCGY